MEQPVTFAKFNGIPQGIEGEGLSGKWPESPDVLFFADETITRL
jgi:hypothetical protein